MSRALVPLQAGAVQSALIGTMVKMKAMLEAITPGTEDFALARAIDSGRIAALNRLRSEISPGFR